MILRDYQHTAVRDVRQALARHRSVILALQTGGGKTVIACEMFRLALERGRRCLFVVHRIELVEQAFARLSAFGIEAGIIKAGYEERRHLPVQIACVPTLVRREMPEADFVIFDECHHGVSPSWFKVLDHYRKQGAWILGITATPQRLDGKPLGDAFDTIIEPVKTSFLVAMGYLIDPIIFAPPEPDMKGVKVRMGDYSLPELAERMSPLTGHITRTWRDRAQGLRTLCFAVNVKHSKLLANEFARVGARVAHVDGTSPKEYRSDVNRMLRSGELDVVTQCQLWTEGVDIPELGCLVIARPTQSLSLHRQMIGRVMRPAPGKTDALVLDHAGNTWRHGLMLDDIEWSLEGAAQKESSAPSVRTCEECFAVLRPGATECHICGFEPEKAEAEELKVDNPGELVRIDMIRRKATMVEKQRKYRTWVQQASQWGYKLAWARYRYKDEFGSWPRLGEIERAHYVCSGHEWERKDYGSRRVVRCARCLTESRHATA